MPLIDSSLKKPPGNWHSQVKDTHLLKCTHMDLRAPYNSEPKENGSKLCLVYVIFVGGKCLRSTSKIKLLSFITSHIFQHNLESYDKSILNVKHSQTGSWFLSDLFSLSICETYLIYLG
jgi:hypothetical protein